MPESRWTSVFRRDLSVEECVQGAILELEGAGSPTVCFLFVSEAFKTSYQWILDTLSQHFGSDTILFGSSGSGLTGAGLETEHQPGLSLLCGWLPHDTLVPFHLQEVPNLDAPPDEWRALIAPQLETISGLILIADPFTFEADTTLSGIDYAYPDVPKVGGLASGCHGEGEAALFCGQELYRKGCVGIAFSGPSVITPAVCQGCKGFGEQFVVTKGERNIILELSGKPATAALGETLEGLTREQKRAYLETSIFVGLGAGQPQLQYGPGDFLVRQVVGADKRSGALVVGSRVRNGQTLQFHLRNAETSRFDAENVLTKTIAGLKSPVKASLLFSCLGRGQGLYGEPHHDSKLLQKVAGSSPAAGFFCNGEMGPVGGETNLHGFTSSFALFS